MAPEPRAVPTAAGTGSAAVAAPTPPTPRAAVVTHLGHSEEVAPKTVEQLMEDESLVLVEDVVKGE